MYRCIYGQGGHYLIWPRRVSATEQGLVFKAWSRTLGIQFHYLVSWRVCLSNSSPGLFPWKLGGGALSTRLGSLSNDDGDVNENGKKAIGLDWQNNNFARASGFFCTFLCSHCTTTTWKCQISRFMEYVKTRQRLSFPFPELRYSLSEFNSRENCQHLIN